MNNRDKASDETESHARTICLGGGDFSGVYRPGGGNAASHSALRAGEGECAEKSSSGFGCAFRESPGTHADARAACHAVYGAGTAAIRKRPTRAIPPGAPLVRADFSERERSGGNQWAEAGIRKDHRRRGRESGYHSVWQFLSDRTREGAVACAAAGVRAASRVDDSRIRDWAGSGDDPANHGDILCGRGYARAYAGAERIFRHGVLDWIHVADDCGGNLDQLYAARGGANDPCSERSIQCGGEDALIRHPTACVILFVGSDDFAVLDLEAGHVGGKLELLTILGRFHHFADGGL